MKSLKLSFVFLISLLLNCNVDKTTTAHGRVYNYISGNPVAGVRVVLTGYDGNYPHDSVNPDPCETVETTTNLNGEYELEVGCKGMDKVSIGAGYAYAPYSNGFYDAKRSGNLRLGKSNEIDFQIDSIDGKINFQFQNLKATDDTLYVLVQCNALYEGPFLYCGGHNKIGVEAGAISSKLWYVTANRYVKYYWDTLPFTGLLATHIDSIYCARNDSVSCVISF